MTIENLQDLTAWDSAERHERAAIVHALARRLLPRFEFLDIQAYACGGQNHEIAAFRHGITGLRFHLLPGATYLMGQSDRETSECLRRGYKGDLPETPASLVTVEPFLVAHFFVTESAWHQQGGKKLHWNFGPDHPADGISRKEASDWCAKAGLRLPDEKEWEHFCRAGTQSLFYWGDEPNPKYAWTKDQPMANDYRNHTASEHTGACNAFGLIDTLGHLTEWVADDLYYYEHGIPEKGPYVDPEDQHADGIQRGGFFHCGWNLCRCSARIQSSDYGETGMSVRPVVSLASALGNEA